MNAMGGCGPGRDLPMARIACLVAAKAPALEALVNGLPDEGEWLYRIRVQSDAMTPFLPYRGSRLVFSDDLSTGEFCPLRIPPYGMAAVSPMDKS